MTPPTLKQILEKATPGKWNAGSRRGYNRNTIYAQSKLGEMNDKSVAQVYGIPINHHTEEPLEAKYSEGEANAQLIARCSPSVMLAVLSALESCQYSHCGDKTMQHYNPVLVDKALNLLNGKAP